MELPKAPQEIELRNIIDKLAQFVARNGPEFEQMTKNKQKGNPKFGFLYGGEHFNYYQYKVTTEQAILKQKASRDIPIPVQTTVSNLTNVTNSLANVSMTLPPVMMSSVPPVTVVGNTTLDLATAALSAAAVSAAQWMVAQQQVPVQPQVQQQQQQQGTSNITSESLSVQQTQLQEQIRQSEQNLAAQHLVLMQQQQSQIEDALRKASLEALQRSADEVGINIAELDAVLQPIIDTCTKDSISAGKSWILAHCTNPTSNAVVAKCLLKKVVHPGAPFTLKLHIIYLINDVLHHCARKNADELKQALEDVVVPMFCNTSVGTSDEQQSKLAKLLNLWESKNNYFDAAIIKKMKSPSVSWSEYQASQISVFASAITPITTTTKITFESYSAQHQAFVNHALQQIQTIEQQKATLEQQQQEELQLQQQQAQLMEVQQQQQQQQQLPPPNLQPPLDSQSIALALLNSQMNLGQAPPMMMNASGHMNTPPPTILQNDVPPPDINFSQPPPGYNPLNFPPGAGVELPDFSKPPPGFPLPPPLNNIPPPDIMEEQLMPSVPYFELPAGLMVPLIKLEESEYKPLDPDCIRLPPPAPPSERLLAAVEAFYGPPSHDRPRDSEGWEKLGLYEYYRAKNGARKKKEDDIAEGLREKSRSPSPIVRMRSKSKSPPKKRYRSRSRSRSKSQPRSKSRSRSRSRTPPPRHGNSRPSANNGRRSPPQPQRKLSASSRPYQRSSRSRSRSRSQSRSPSRSPNRSQQRSPERSPTPPSFLGSTYSKAEALRHIDESNKGHQMLRKMGWGGAGLGAKEQGIEQPISGGEVRDRTDMYKGVGINLNDPYESFRKSKGQAFINRMKARAEERI